MADMAIHPFYIPCADSCSSFGWRHGALTADIRARCYLSVRHSGFDFPSIYPLDLFDRGRNAASSMVGRSSLR